MSNPTVQEEEQEGDPCVKTSVHPVTSASALKPVMEASGEESSGDADPGESTYVSESDLDITEVETLPYTESPQCQGHEGQRSGPVQNQRAEKEEQTHLAAEQDNDDDPFRLVREIFFTWRWPCIEMFTLRLWEAFALNGKYPVKGEHHTKSLYYLISNNLHSSSAKLQSHCWKHSSIDSDWTDWRGETWHNSEVTVMKWLS